MPFSVFANNMEVAGKAATGQSPAAFPDTCWTPPTSPPTPTGVPVPYPNTCFAKDITNGSKTVKAHGKEVAMENKSYFSTSVGDEPATMALQKGLISQTEKGKCYFQMWSMNVKVEGAGVPRHLDIVTHNHRNQPNTPPMAYLSNMSIANLPDCHDENEAIEKTCQPKGEVKFNKKGKPNKTWVDDYCEGFEDKPKTKEDTNEMTDKADSGDNKCLQAKKCQLVPYSTTNTKSVAKKGAGCCPGQTGHHVLPDGMFREPFPTLADHKAHEVVIAGLKAVGLKILGRDSKPTMPDWKGYTEGGGLTVCAEGTTNAFDWGSHGNMHQRSQSALKKTPRDRLMSYMDARNKMAKTMEERYPQCSKECTAAQLDAYYSKAAKDKDGDSVPLKQAKLQPHDGTSGGGMKKPSPTQLED